MWIAIVVSLVNLHGFIAIAPIQCKQQEKPVEVWAKHRSHRYRVSPLPVYFLNYCNNNAKLFRLCVLECDDDFELDYF
jgi:hypothetical protein